MDVVTRADIRTLVVRVLSAQGDQGHGGRSAEARFVRCSLSTLVERDVGPHSAGGHREEDGKLAGLWRHVLDAPGDAGSVRVLVDGLHERARAQPELMSALVDLVDLLQPADDVVLAEESVDGPRDQDGHGQPARREGVHASGPPPPAQANTITGHVQVHGPTVQAGAIHGSVHIHTTQTPGPVPPRSPALHQLPPVSSHFTSRSTDLDTLDGLLGAKPDHAPLILVVHGAAGVGKTTLVSAWLRAVQRRFPDGELYADLRGHSLAEAAGPQEILGQFLRSLGAGAVPAGLAEQSSLWRSMTAGLQLAVMLDNAATAAQIRPLLLGSPGSIVVVTSRNRLPGLSVDGAVFHPLRMLDTGAGIELLTRGIGGQRVAREPDAARRVVELCAGLPLAVCLAAARLAVRPRLPIQTMADALGRDSGPLDVLKVEGKTAVRSALDLSYAALGDDAARLYRQLAMLPLPTFDTRVAAAAGALALDEAEGLLDQLIEANLLEDAGPGPDSCRFHDLVRDHARETAVAADVSGTAGAETVRRVCDLFLATASAAEARLTPAQFVLSRNYRYEPDLPVPFDTDASALSWLDEQRLNLMACLRAAAQRQWYDLGWQLTDASWPLFLRMRYYDLWIEAHEIGLDCARRSEHPERREAVRQMLNSGAIGLSAARRTDTAIKWYEDALQAARDAGDVRDEGQALLGLGGCHLDAGRRDQALEYLHRAIEAWEECGYLRGVGLALTVIGEAQVKTDRAHEAVTQLTRAQEIFVSVHDPHDAARALALLGRARVRAGDHDTGVAELDEALAVFTASGALHWQARTLEMLGDSAQEHGDQKAAAHHFEEAMTRYGTTNPSDAERIRQRLDSETSTGGARDAGR